MNAARFFQSVICMALLTVLVTGGVLGQAIGKTDVLDLIPGQSLVLVRINQFDNTLGQVDKFLAGLAPTPIQKMVQGQLGQVLGSDEAKGVDINGDFAAFIVAGESYGSDMPPIYPGILIPISNYDRFIKGNPNCGEPDAEGVSTITGIDMIAIKAGKHALITQAKLRPQLLQYQEALGADGLVTMESMAGRLAAADVKEAAQTPVWIHGNVAQASRVFKPLLEGKFEQFKGMITQKVEEESPTGATMDVGLFVNMYAAIFEMLLDQTQSLSLSIDPQPEVLRITETISAVPGSDLAAMLAKDTTGQPNNLIGFASDGAAVSFAGTIGDSWKAMYTWGIDLMSGLMGDSMTPEAAAQMKTMTVNIIDALEGPVAGSFSLDGNKKPVFGVTYAITVKDAKTFTALMKESTELFNESGFGDLYKGMGIKMDYTIDYAADSYQDVSIDKARLSLKTTQPDSPLEQVIEGVYDGGFDYRWAMVDKICILAVGADADARIRQMVDRIEAGTYKQTGSDMKASFDILPGADQADFVLNYNYVRILNVVGAVAKTMGEDGPELNVPTSSHLSIAGWGGENQAHIGIAVPKQHIMEIVDAFTQLSQMDKQ